MAPRLWQILTFLLSTPLFLILASAKPTPATDSLSYLNHAIVRTIELDGAITHITTTYSIQSLVEGNEVYEVAYDKIEDATISWRDVKLKGNNDYLEIKRSSAIQQFNPSELVSLYSINLGRPLAKDENITLTINTIQSHASLPYPASVKQTDTQGLLYKTGSYVLSPYETVNQRTKLRVPTPGIRSFYTSETLSRFSPDSAPLKSGATVTYGPFYSIPPSADTEFVKEYQEEIYLHYDYDGPVMTVVEYKRSAEISHWGSNLNIQDDMWFRNDGATLKGHFSRIDYQMQNHQAQNAGSGHLLRALVMHIPAGARDPYYYDQIGNVSTSRFQQAPRSSKRGSVDRWSALELKPRYPILGGWNYTFTVGYDLPLEDWASYDASRGRYIAAVPFFTAIPGAAVDQAEVKIILPEGATDITIHPPFPTDSIERTTHITYLDTTGRQAIIFKKKNLTDKHNGLIYVTYKVSLAAHLKKPIAVATASLALFALALVMRRIDMRIHKTVS